MTTQHTDALRDAIKSTREYAGKACIHEVSERDAAIIWQAARAPLLADLKLAREALSSARHDLASQLYIRQYYAEVIAKLDKTLGEK